jgi:uncharacterized protein
MSAIENLEPGKLQPHFEQDHFHSFMRNTYLTMAGGLGITALMSMAIINTGMINVFLNNLPLFIGLLVAKLVLVLVVGSTIKKIPANVALFLFILYAGLSGVTISFCVARFSHESIGLAFAIASGTFGATATWAHYTKANLLKWGSFLTMALIGLIIAMVANLFIGNTLIDYIISACAVLVFTAYTAYDVKKLKHLYTEPEFADRRDSLCIYGALDLYLDYINLFIHILRLIGRRG